MIKKAEQTMVIHTHMDRTHASNRDDTPKNIIGIRYVTHLLMPF